jgi:phosphoenolpyruvate carboxykinase (ATP)
MNQNVRANLSSKELLAIALAKGEGVQASNGTLVVTTGARTGRSPKDRFIVKDAATEKSVDWNAVNQGISPEKFQALWDKANAYLEGLESVYQSELAVGADPAYQLNVTVKTDTAWQQLFCRNQFITDFTKGGADRAWTLIGASGFTTDPARDGVNSDATMIVDFANRRVLGCGLRYAGELKKSMFSVMNFLMPAQDVLPMHCSANVGKKGDVALFFGLSGTGKTTLSADPERYLIGDDEHGWSDHGIFNFEGGCYAKCIDLSQKTEPVIWEALREGSILENVVLDPVTKVPDYHDASLTQNSRASYPLAYIPMRVEENRAGQPHAVIFLTCDLYGVLPPVAKLTNHQAAYYFLSGYTALVGSTEMGSGSGIKSTFSVCFGAAFMPRAAAVYADLLLKKLETEKCPVYLVNTGWTGGRHGQGGKRFAIPVTRAVITGILDDELAKAEYETMPGFNIAIPKSLTGVYAKLLNPRNTWADKAAYDTQAAGLIDEFTNNFKRFNVSEKISSAGPVAAMSACTI